MRTPYVVRSSVLGVMVVVVVVVVVIAEVEF